MLRPGGYFTATSPDRAVEECDTATCAHCQKIIFVRPKQRPEDIGGLCKLCMGIICSACVELGHCDPFEKKLERAEARERFRREIMNA